MRIGVVLFGLAPMMMARSSPVPNVAVVDFTGQGHAARIADALKGDEGGRPQGYLVAPPGAPFATPAAATAALKPYVAGTQHLPGDRVIDTVAILKPAHGTVAIDVWSRNVIDPNSGLIQRTVADAVRREALRRAGVDAKALQAIEGLAPEVSNYSPKAAGKVSMRDRLPGLAGFGMGILLWTVVFTGAGMLLNSVIEEKSTRILEVLLSSASVPEIMAGKILGVAAVTTTVLIVWVTLGGTALTLRRHG